MTSTTRVTSATFVKGVIGSDPIFSDKRAQVAFIGRSNVGKSSILNAVTEVRGLAKVSKKPGKTRQINFFFINRKLYFVDLPGYGYAIGSRTEQETIRKHIIWYFTSGEAKIRHVVLIIDAVVGPTALDHEMLGFLRDAKTSLLVAANKVDKLKSTRRDAQLEAIRAALGVSVMPCSTKTGEGIPELTRAVLA